MKLPRVAAPLFALAVLGCSPTDLGKSAFGPSTPAHDIESSGEEASIRAVAAPGVKSLAAGDYQSAVTQFEVALMSRPRSPDLHFLAGIAYRMLSDEKGESYRELAKTALNTALQLDPSHVLAARELGRILIEDGRYQEAEALYARAVSLDAADQPTMAGLTLAAYFSADDKVARWGSARLDENTISTWQIRALVDGMVGNEAQAEADVRQFVAMGAAPARVKSLRAALAAWNGLRGLASVTDDATPAPGADASPPAAAAPPPDASGGVSGFAFGGASAGTPPASAPISTGPVSPNWNDCQQTATPPNPNAGGFGGFGGGGGGGGFGGGGFGGGGQSAPDETTSLPALPAPCKGLPLPRMVMLDAVIVRTIINGSSAYGVNLLSPLQVVLQGNLLDTVTKGTTVNRTWTKSGSVATPTAGIQYSLNIANASGNRSEVLSRPSLLALDRQPSNFFSGSNVTIALQGQLGGGNLSSLPVGINLSATPTFISDDDLLLSVKTTRTFFEAPSGGTFAQSIQTSRNTVTANVMMHMGQTLVLSGLSERETQATEDEVPVLGKIPLLQYLTKNANDFDYRTYLIILITPRAVQAPAHDGDLPTDRLADDDRKRLDEFRRRFVPSELKPLNNMEVIRYHMRTNQMYRVLAGGTLNDEAWAGSSERFKFLNQIVAGLYF